jgi:hypothetical protein
MKNAILRRVDLIRTDVSEDRIVFIIRVTRIGRVLLLLVTANAVSSSPILVTLLVKAIRSLETSIHTRATKRNIPEEDILHSHRRKNLKS